MCIRDRAIGIESVDGILVTEVPKGPADEAGIKSGDVIIKFDEIDVKNTKELVKVVGNTDVGKIVDVSILRKGELKTVKVKLGQRELAEAIAFPSVSDTPPPKVEKILGMNLSELNDELRTKFNLDTETTGLIVLDVSNDSEAAQKGVKVGDLIVEVSQERIAFLKDFKEFVKSSISSGKVSLLFLLRSDGDFRFLSLRLE